MRPSFILLLFRSYRQLQKEDIAKILDISVESYNDVEEGKLKINIILAQKLSDFY